MEYDKTRMKYTFEQNYKNEIGDAGHTTYRARLQIKRALSKPSQILTML